MRREIPAPIISVVADVIAQKETHATLDSLFMYAGAPGDPPDGSKHTKALEWLRRVNKDGNVDPMKVLGRLIESYMDAVEEPASIWAASILERIEKVPGVDAH